MLHFHMYLYSLTIRLLLVNSVLHNTILVKFQKLYSQEFRIVFQP